MLLAVKKAIKKDWRDGIAEEVYYTLRHDLQVAIYTKLYYSLEPKK